MKKLNVSIINNMAQHDPEAMALQAEERFHARLNEVAKNIFERREKRIVMLAGPSASGKTTSAHLIADKLAALGAKAFIVSLDDFYKNQEDAVLLPDGKPDLETVHALDIPLLDRCLYEIINSGAADLPVFNFEDGRRKGESRRIELDADDVIIVEGIHALNPLITEPLPDENLMKLYISVSSRIFDDEGKTLLSKRDLRLIRRLVRDYYHRASSVERTFELWQNVLKGEEKYIFPFSHMADERIDSMHAYEPCVFRSLAVPKLEELGADSGFYEDTRRITASLERFEPLPVDVIPDNSLLNEFME